jgi:type II secretory pathway component GspD/PulD (secretin)
MIDAEIIETSLSKLKSLGVEWGTGSEGALFKLTPAKRSTRMPFSTLFGNPGAHAPVASGTPGITLGSLDSSQAIGVLQALESDSDTKILARPKVLTLDNESALIRLTTDHAIGFKSTGQQSTGTTTAEPERQLTGVVMVVTPQVNEKGYITMLVEPSVTKVVSSSVSAPTGQAKPVDPKTRGSRTLVRIRSGDTLVVGGLIDRTDKELVRRVPVLSGIPFIGGAFKNTEREDSASELIVFVTPRLLEEATAEQIAGVGSPLGLREQEPAASRQESIEEALNELEQSKM